MAIDIWAAAGDELFVNETKRKTLDVVAADAASSCGVAVAAELGFSDSVAELGCVAASCCIVAYDEGCGSGMGSVAAGGES